MNELIELIEQHNLDRDEFANYDLNELLEGMGY